jgi:hypothetical protein
MAIDLLDVRENARGGQEIRLLVGDTVLEVYETTIGDVGLTVYKAGATVEEIDDHEDILNGVPFGDIYIDRDDMHAYGDIEPFVGHGGCRAVFV